ncbi:CRAL-TRIO domain-containing protein [Nephila pilipes]|uniref:CRAL-TRIO domain-containing protein n=1 Tax=Nephila pilipes TaxID=299642 RepID=A0A8X6ISM6_NEPPI|nr:CRAL-TRIO domain-containing protein [Nephila pilipes]
MEYVYDLEAFICVYFEEQSNRQKKVPKPKFLQKETMEILPFEVTNLPEQYRVKLEKELNETTENKAKCLQELKILLKGEKTTKHIEFEDDFLQQYLRHSKYDTTIASIKVRNFTALRRKHGWLFQSIEFQFTQNLSSKYACYLPYRCPDGYCISFLQLGKWNPEELTFEDFARISFIMNLQLIRFPLSQITGVKTIVDCKNTGLRHLKYCTLQNIILLYNVTMECFPINYSDIHVINQSSLMNLLWKMAKPILPEFVKNMFIFHSSTEELFDYFPRSVIPNKYKGELVDYYSSNWLMKANEQQKTFPGGGQRNID